MKVDALLFARNVGQVKIWSRDFFGRTLTIYCLILLETIDLLQRLAFLNKAAESVQR